MRALAFQAHVGHRAVGPCLTRCLAVPIQTNGFPLEPLALLAFAAALDVTAWAASARQPGETPIPLASVLEGEVLLLGLTIGLLSLFLRQAAVGWTTSTIIQR